MKILSFDVTNAYYCTTAKMVVEFQTGPVTQTKTFTGWSKIHPNDLRRGSYDPNVGERIAVGRMWEEASLYMKHTMSGMEYPDPYSPVMVMSEDALSDIEAAELTPNGRDYYDYDPSVDNFISNLETLRTKAAPMERVAPPHIAW